MTVNIDVNIEEYRERAVSVWLSPEESNLLAAVVAVRK
jgi:hypothetical protein